MYFFNRSFSGQQPMEALLGAEATESHVVSAAVLELGDMVCTCWYSRRLLIACEFPIL